MTAEAAGEPVPATAAQLLEQWTAWSLHRMYSELVALREADGDYTGASGARLCLAELTAECTSRGYSIPGTLDALEALGHLLRGLSMERADAIQQARAEGATWGDIGARLQMTKQGAQLAYTRAQAEREKDLAGERAARKPGPAPKLDARRRARAREMLAADGLVQDVAKRLQVHRSTLGRTLRQHAAEDHAAEDLAGTADLP